MLCAFPSSGWDEWINTSSSYYIIFRPNYDQKVYESSVRPKPKTIELVKSSQINHMYFIITHSKLISLNDVSTNFLKN